MTLGKYVWSVWKLWRGVWKNSTLPATNLLFGHLFFSSGQRQGLPVALKVDRCASTFLR